MVLICKLVGIIWDICKEVMEFFSSCLFSRKYVVFFDEEDDWRFGGLKEFNLFLDFKWVRSLVCYRFVWGSEGKVGFRCGMLMFISF